MTNSSGGGTGSLQRITVLVLLGLLIFVTVADWLDTIFGHGDFEPSPGLYTLVGGVITGLFSAEVIRGWRSSRKPDQEEDEGGEED